MSIGIFANDPGGATGLAWAVLDTDVSLEDALRGKTFSGSATITGTPHEQIREIAAYWRKFVRGVTIPRKSIYYVCEDFIYAPGVNYEGDSGKISTSIIWGVEGYLMGEADEFRRLRRGAKVHAPPAILQSASQAKGFATNARLKEWDCWVVGRDHERSAYQHLAYFLKRYMIQHQ